MTRKKYSWIDIDSNRFILSISTKTITKVRKNCKINEIGLDNRKISIFAY